MREEDIKKTEALKMNDLSVEEVAERRSKLRQMRELMFREEARAKRVAKIKSKAFRKIHRKEKEKLDNASNAGRPEDDDGERMKMEVERARERATLRHKNTSKWAKAMKARGEFDEDEDQDQHRDINEKLEREERLARRIRGEDSEGENGDTDDDDDDTGLEIVKARAFEELQSLTHVGVVSGQRADEKSTSVFEMKFMKEAAARQRRDVDDMMDEFRKELGEIPMNSDDEEEQNEDSDTVTANRANGRMTFRPSQVCSSSSF